VFASSAFRAKSQHAHLLRQKIERSRVFRPWDPSKPSQVNQTDAFDSVAFLEVGGFFWRFILNRWQSAAFKRRFLLKAVVIPMSQLVNEIQCAHNQDGGTVLDIRQGKMFVLNRVGSRMLQLLEAGCGEKVIVDTLLGEFDVDRDIALNDLRLFLLTLARFRLIETGDSKRN
jgi:Coenzyme PQQ synthesis protein D (PqqD)